MNEQARVYLETSFISYLSTALQDRFSNDPNTAHWQLTSRVWWERNRTQFALDDAVRSRLEILSCAETLKANPRAIGLTKQLVDPTGPLPQKAEADATHIALASVYGCDYLLTWNFKHIANAMLQRSIYKIIQVYGYRPPIICTPEELMENRYQ